MLIFGKYGFLDCCDHKAIHANWNKAEWIKDGHLFSGMLTFAKTCGFLETEQIDDLFWNNDLHSDERASQKILL